MKAAPFGVGWLIVTGALPDPRALYCPSANDQSFRTSAFDPGAGSQLGSWDGSSTDTYQNWEMGKNPRMSSASMLEVAQRRGFDATWVFPKYPNYGGASEWPDTLRDWRNAGTFEGRTLTHGKWNPKLMTCGGGYAVYGQYAYRNQPLITSGNNVNQDITAAGTTGGDNSFMPITIFFTKPKIVSAHDCPAFKTPRQLRGRALMSDSFNKTGTVIIPGFGNQAHKDGYNVLYGDYSTRWYGDNEQRIMYWDVSQAIYGHAGLGRGGRHYVAEHPSYGAPMINAALRDPMIWHNMDKFGNLDTDVNPSAWVVD